MFDDGLEDGVEIGLYVFEDDFVFNVDDLGLYWDGVF